MTEPDPLARPDGFDRFDAALAASAAMREVFVQLRASAKQDVHVVLSGEAGTGRRFLAQCLHRQSARAGQPCIVFDLAEESAHVLTVSGAWERAMGGTLIVRDGDQLPLSVLQELRRRILLQTTARQVRVVLITGVRPTHENLFNAELHALFLPPVTIPPLDARKTDIIPLASCLLRELDPRLTFRVCATDWIQDRAWPRNLRGLAQAIQKASAANAVGLEIRREHFEPASIEPWLLNPHRSYGDTMAAIRNDFERRYVAWLLARHDGNISAAARAADMDRKHLHKLAKKHGVHRKA